MDKKIVIIGKKGSGKSVLAQKIGWKNFDGDAVRKEFNNSDFSIEGRIEQARTMGFLMKAYHGDSIASFICPTHKTMQEFLHWAPKNVRIIWMDTVKTDIPSVWENPIIYDIVLTDFDYDIWKILGDLGY